MAIKSFQGARRQQGNDTNNIPFSVSDYMTKDLITFTPDQTIESVMQSLIKNSISGGPVVNDDSELIGIISESDCIKQISESRYYNMPMQDATIEKYFTKDVDTIDSNMNIFDAASMFVQTHRRRFPVVENGKLVGQISQNDVLKAAMQLKGQNWK
ncbi:CBS domain-containing protein [Algibacter sp. PT7-4]|uniref:CBS domain-containing protein n=1 Tax=Algibacter ulvanivorans TaxID=3400999 RepID=UPI003AAB2B18